MILICLGRFHLYFSLFQRFTSLNFAEYLSLRFLQFGDVFNQWLWKYFILCIYSLLSSWNSNYMYIWWLDIFPHVTDAFFLETFSPSDFSLHYFQFFFKSNDFIIYHLQIDTSSDFYFYSSVLLITTSSLLGSFSCDCFSSQLWLHCSVSF